MKIGIQMRYATAAEWTAANTVLAVAEQGYETDTGKQKIGDGVTAWNALGYWAGGGAIGNHAAQHAAGQADALTPAAIGAEADGAVTRHNGAAAAHPFSAVDRYRYGGTAGATTEGTITAAGRALLDDATAAAQQATLGIPKANLAATTAPGVTDDSAAGYSVGSRWIDTVGAVEYVCMDPSAGAAVWEATTGAAGVGGNTGSVDNAVLRADGAGGAAMQGSDIVVEDSTVTGSRGRAILGSVQPGVTTGDIVIRGIGTSSLIFNDGGLARGLGAIDLRGERTYSGNVASGQYSALIGGHWSSATQQDAGVFAGLGGSATGAAGVVLGGVWNSAAGDSSVATGCYALARLSGQIAHAAGRFAANGDAQAWSIVGRKQIASTDPTQITFGTAEARLTITADMTWCCAVRIVARQDDGSSGYAERRVCIQRTGTATSLVGTVQTIGADAWDAALGTPTIAITADDANEALAITVTQANTTATRWVAVIDAVEVGY